MQPKKKFGFKGNKKKQTVQAVVTEDKKTVKATTIYHSEGTIEAFLNNVVVWSAITRVS